MNVYKIDSKWRINDYKFIHIFASFIKASLYIETGTSSLFYF